MISPYFLLSFFLSVIAGIYIVKKQQSPILLCGSLSVLLLFFTHYYNRTTTTTTTPSIVLYLIWFSVLILGVLAGIFWQYNQTQMAVLSGFMAGLWMIQPFSMCCWLGGIVLGGLALLLTGSYHLLSSPKYSPVLHTAFLLFRLVWCIHLGLGVVYYYYY